MSTGAVPFRDLLQVWAESACEEWRYPPPDDDWYAEVLNRVPSGVGALLAQGVADGLVLVTAGHKFGLRGLPPGKGPYAFFSRSQTQRLGVNWEYLAQAAEYARLDKMLDGTSYRIGV